MDGIHIVAFAEEADPGEGRTLVAGAGVVEGHRGAWEMSSGFRGRPSWECRGPGVRQQRWWEEGSTPTLLPRLPCLPVPLPLPTL